MGFLTASLIAGKTVIWGPGLGFYYSPDFTLEKIWEDIRGTGSWRVDDDDAVCRQIPGWGPRRANATVTKVTC